MDDHITFVGLDISKKAISVGVAPGDPREAVGYFGTIEHRADALRRLSKALSRDGYSRFLDVGSGIPLETSRSHIPFISVTRRGRSAIIRIGG